MTTIDTDLTDASPDINEIERAIRMRLAFLRPLVEEHDRLAKARDQLDKALAKLKP